MASTMKSIASRTGVAGRIGVRSQAAMPARRCTGAARPRPLVAPLRAIEIDITDPDVQVAIAGVVLGVVAGFGAPLWYINRIEKDDERLEELRAINRATYEATGEYMNEKEIATLRKPKWTDRREYQDDD